MAVATLKWSSTEIRSDGAIISNNTPTRWDTNSSYLPQKKKTFSSARGVMEHRRPLFCPVSLASVWKIHVSNAAVNISQSDKISPRGSCLCQTKSPAEVPFPGFLNHCLFGEFGLPDILEQRQQFINSLTSTARLVILFSLAGSYFYFFKRYNSITWNCWSCIFIRSHQ